MLDVSKIRAALFAKNLQGLASFYSEALGMIHVENDEHHAVLQQDDFELVIHQIPHSIADQIEILEPPVRREDGAVRLDYPVVDIRTSREVARSLGGDIDEAPPGWAERGTNFYLGCDPEGNVFGVSEQRV